ncbi:MAG TPA: ABC-type transport auxiliary lipoprotein family protein [Azonexus sp.]|nr:ABC-type transport auxiliary lipoprotein family protein [Azonexus sp.]
MRATALAGMLTLATALFGCSNLLPRTPPPTLYALDSTPPAGTERQANQHPSAVPAGAPTLVVNLPRAAAGYNSQRMIYLRQPYALEYFAHSQWVDTPARLLQPLIIAAVERSGRFGAIVAMPVSSSGDFRLETELLRLQQEFLSQPSRVHLTLRATLTDMATRRVVAWRQFDAVVPAASDDPYAGVVAANRAVGEVLEQLAAFCAAATDGWRPAETTAGQRP